MRRINKSFLLERLVTLKNSREDAVINRTREKASSDAQWPCLYSYQWCTEISRSYISA